ncbi:hypothetical protein HG536_0A00310 [Torulaspora globosa]|uniref:Oligomycin resistance ATP-dependent permease YOR1 n=1 Tax=Torulaspora globosa TaxID=48254 RepID=A0A7G3Z9M8_9SACH|nr:uncharacterized protein HG536_0A00310 [Torulaspora globosa]QLL30214.1 hypothetical protein HG536_0A00310 [Torulaspora globosa]
MGKNALKGASTDSTGSSYRSTPEDKSGSRRSSVEAKLSYNDASQENQELSGTGEYIVNRNRPETFLNSDDLEKVTQSDVYAQKRLFSFLHRKKLPLVPEKDDERRTFPMHRANYLSRVFLWWVIPIIRVGYKRTVQPNDLFKMDERMSIEKLFDSFDRNMRYYFDKSRRQYLEKNPGATEEEVLANARLPRLTTLRALYFTFQRQYLWAVLCAILANCTSGFNPMITKRLIEFVEKKALMPHLPVNSGVGYAIGACLMLLLNGIFFNHFFLASQTIGVQAKSVLTKAALNKMFHASAYARHKYPNGKVTSFVTTDLSRIEFALSFQPFLAGFPAIFAICIVLLIVNVGPIALVGIGVFILMFFLTLFAFKIVIELRMKSNKLTDSRVTIMRELLNNMKMVKYYAWEDAYEKNVRDIRSKEISKVRNMLYTRNFMIGLALSLPNIASLVTFLAMYKVNRGGRSPGNIFASLSLFQVLSLQMFFLPISIATGIDMILGLGRLQDLLEAPEERTDNVESIRPTSDMPKNVVLRMTDASFEWEDFEVNDLAEEKKKLQNSSAKKSRKKNSKSDEEPQSSKIDNSHQSEAKEKKSFHGFNCLNFEIEKGEFIMVTGPIGTGKTSLLNAMAGFMRRISGNVEVNGDLLMCGYPWIQNATVRDNILFGSPFDEKRFKEVIRVCSLQADIDMLPAGDMTEIGERGITLSGGQKARINLARSVYKQKDIFLFDDVLSAVDSRVGKHIMDECMLGLLQNKTRILATHQLSLIEKASRIIVLGADGSFEIGKLEDLKQTNLTLKNLLQFAAQKSEAEETDEAEQEGLGDAETELNKERTKDWSELQKQLSKRSKEVEVSGRLTSKEERAVNSLKLNVYKKYIEAAVGKWGFLAIPGYLFLVVATTFCSLFSSVWLSYWTEQKFANRSASFYMGLYSFFVFGGFLFMTGQFTMLCYMGVRASKRLNLQAVGRILHTSMAYLDTTPIGRILNRFTKDTDSLDNELMESLRLFMTQFANIVGVCVLCIVYLPWFAIAVPFLVLFFVLIANHYQATGREVKRLEAVQRSFVYNNFNEVLGGMDTIKAYRNQERFLVKTDFLINKTNEAGYLVVALQRWVAIFLDMVAIAFALIITLLCVTRQFHISAASTGVLLTYVLQLPGLLNTILRAFTQTENDMNSAERLVAYATDLPLEADYKIPESSPPENWPSEGEIIFEEVSFAYRPGLPVVLHNLNLQIKRGEKIGICGRTGAGKSTIMSALYRINELADGRILIDGIDISKIGLYDLRRKLSIIPQDPVLFRGTIRKNLDPFQESSDDKLWEALVNGGIITAAELDVVQKQKPDESGSLSNLHKFHLDQKVEEEGSNFSLGERQLLALARALVRQSKILILDEATSSVDYETDNKIQSRISASFGNCTILCIAHRLKTILSYDRILVLDKGEIAELDTPKALYERTDGIFREMCNRSGLTEADFN